MQDFSLNGSNPIEDGLQALNERLDAQRDEREAMAQEIILESFVNKAHDLSSQIMNIMVKYQGWRKIVQYLVVNEIKRIVDGNLAVPFFSTETKAAQTVYLYIGTHWEILEPQKFYDFVNDSARKIGLGDTELCDSSFMKKLYDGVAFNVSHHRELRIPKGKAWINLKNGTLEIDMNGEFTFREHRREDWFCYCLDYSYDPKAECNKWHEFLDEVLPDSDTQALLAEYIGYCFTSGVKAEKMLVLYGRGSNGKSVVLSTITSLFGEKNVSNVSLSDLTTDASRRILIENKLANISYESGRELNHDTLKTMISGEPVLIKSLYHDVRNMTHYGKLFTAFNELPGAENTYGYFRRWLLMLFKVTITEDKADIDLPKKLAQELPGILNWVLEHLQVFLRNRSFSKSEECDKALQAYKLSSDNVRLFFIENCKTDAPTPLSGKAIFNAYVQACRDDGLKPLGKNRFFDRLADIDGVVRSYNGTKPQFNISIVNND